MSLFCVKFKQKCPEKGHAKKQVRLKLFTLRELTGVINIRIF